MNNEQVTTVTGAAEDKKPKIYEVPEANMPQFLARIEKLNKRALKLGVTGIGIDVHSVEDRTKPCKPTDFGAFIEKVSFGSDITASSQWVCIRRYSLIEVKGEAPKFAGWSFAATLQHTGEGTILRTTPEFSGKLDVRFRDAQPHCEHCNVKRNRIDSFVCIHEDGTQKQIGRQCLKDFLGHSDPAMLARWAEIVYSISELAELAEDDAWEGGGGSAQVKRFSLESYLCFVAEAIIRHGYTSGAAAKEHDHLTSTRQVAMENMFPCIQDIRAGRNWTPTESAVELAGKALEHVRTALEAKPEADRSEFDHNLLVVAKQEVISHRDAGIAAYIVQAYQKHVNGEVMRLKAAKSEYVGTEKERYRKQQLTVIGANSFPNQFGDTWYVRYTDVVGNILVWKTSNPCFTDIGHVGLYDYTVKSHEEYKGTKNTYITRVKWLETKEQTPVAEAATPVVQ